jgi:ribosome modulation factor
MALRKVYSVSSSVDAQLPLRTAVVYRDVEFDEFIVKFYIDEKHQKGADYHDDDKQSAISTAETWVTSKDVENEGYRAQAAGKSLQENPHPQDTPSYWAWHKGWHEARKDSHYKE